MQEDNNYEFRAGCLSIFSVWALAMLVISVALNIVLFIKLAQMSKLITEAL